MNANNTKSYQQNVNTGIVSLGSCGTGGCIRQGRQSASRGIGRVTDSGGQRKFSGNDLVGAKGKHDPQK